jgi:hypothetical protein
MVYSPTLNLPAETEGVTSIHVRRGAGGQMPGTKPVVMRSLEFLPGVVMAEVIDDFGRVVTCAGLFNESRAPGEDAA